jgi:tRNA uridine 5-carboxymethylaminomethyl modification enzyme
VSEPYRMFTSRAEYRLMLREDNADLRLTEAGRWLGLVDDARWEKFSRQRDAIEKEQARLERTWVTPHGIQEADAIRVLGKPIEREYSLAALLRRPNVSYRSLMTICPSDNEVEDDRVAEQVETQAKYCGYIARQKDEVDRRADQEEMELPAELDYRAVRGLSQEVLQKLERQRPETLGQAARISGITPAALSLLLVHLKRGSPPQKKRA